MFDLSAIQVVMVLAIALLVFGPRRLPELARSVGRGIRELRSSLDAIDPTKPSPDPSRAAAPGPAPAAATAADEADDVLEGVVVSGDAPPAAAAEPRP